MALASKSNEELLKEYCQGSFKAFDEFFKRNSGLIFQFIVSRVGNYGESEDILQETFIRLHKYIHRYDPNRKALNWVFSIAKNQIITHVSKRKEMTELDVDLVEAKKQICVEARDEVNKILSNLSEEEQTLIIEKFINEESYEEISVRKGIKAPNARQKVSRILKKLRSGT